jgi:flagellar assembly protein FliH
MIKSAPANAQGTVHPGKVKVLRDVPLHDVPHALSRQRAPSVQVEAVEIVQEAPSMDVPAPVASVDDVRIQSIEEEAQRRGYEQGFQEGLQAGESEGYTKGVERGREEAKAEGYARGYELGLEEGREQGFEESVKRGEERAQSEQAAALQAQKNFEDGVERLKALTLSVQVQIDERLAVLEDDMVALCFDAVCRVVGSELVNAAGVKQHLLCALREWGKHSSFDVLMHPDDLALLRANQAPAPDASGADAVSSAGGSGDSLLEEFSGQRVRWTPDPGIAMGGCILRSSEGGLDARLQTQLDGLQRLLLEVRNRRKAQAVTENADSRSLTPQNNYGRRSTDKVRAS